MLTQLFNNRTTVKKAAWLATPLLLLPNFAHAHLVETRFGEFYAGLMHPLMALAHVLPWLAVGLMGGLQTKATSRWALLIFPLAVSTGAIAGSWLPGSEIIVLTNLASFILLGALVALAFTLKLSQFLLVIGIFGITHGYANGAPFLLGSDRWLYIGGVGTAAYLCVAIATAGANTITDFKPWGTIALRACGSWIIAIGLMFGGFTLLVN